MFAHQTLELEGRQYWKYRIEIEKQCPKNPQLSVGQQPTHFFRLPVISEKSLSFFWGGSGAVKECVSKQSK